MSSSRTSGVTALGSTVSGMWRSHSVLSESEGESSPESVQQFRKMRSSTSLNSLRMSLRKRFPLKSVQPNVVISENPTCESFQINKKPSKVTQIKRSAKNSIGNAYQVGFPELWGWWVIIFMVSYYGQYLMERYS